MNLQLDRREREALRWTFLMLPIIAASAVVFIVGSVANAFFSILVMFFLAWLLAFLMDPIVNRLVERLPFLPRGLAAASVFVVTLVVAIGLLAAIASSVISSLVSILGNAPTIESAVATLLAPLQQQLDALGLQINITQAASDLIAEVSANASQILASAVSSGLTLFTFGTTIIFIAVVFVANKGAFLRYLERLVPADQHQLYEEFVTATGRSFGGFIRGQFGLAALYGLVLGGVALLFGIPFAPLILVLTTLLQSVPYFGQLVSWLPLAMITLVFRPDVLVLVLVVELILLLLIQQLVTPRVMGSAVGLNPVLVLAAVFIGAQIAGPIGAVFGVPVLAVIASLFETWLDRTHPVSATEAEDEPAAAKAGEASGPQGHPIAEPADVAPDAPALREAPS